MNILVVEDDHLQAEWITSNLEKAFPGATINRIDTESEFHRQLNYIARNPPDIIIIDVMLRWANPGPDIPPAPEEVRTHGFYRAGFRCKSLLAQNDLTKGIPLILYTVLEYLDLQSDLQDLPARVVYLAKDSDPTHLVQKIRETI
jgi:CheY-like chemotaxis protein